MNMNETFVASHSCTDKAILGKAYSCKAPINNGEQALKGRNLSAMGEAHRKKA